MGTMVIRHARRARFLPATVLVVTGFFLFCVQGCGGSEKPEQDLQQRHVDSVMTVLTQVQKNLVRIQQKEAVVERLSMDIEKKNSRNVRQIGKDIDASIRFIDSTLTASKALIAKLEDENRTSAYRVASLDRLISELKVAINDRDGEVRKLKGLVQGLRSEVSVLMNTVDVLDNFIQEQGDQLYTAYYIGGTVNELVSKGVLVRDGPFGKLFGGRYRLSPDFSVSALKKIDIGETRDLFFSKPVKNLKIVTPHTTGSYELTGGSSSSLLLIRDENEFWKKSRCLVIVFE